MSVLPASLTPSQRKAVTAINRFLIERKDCFLLRGSAGTGKTTLIAKLVDQLIRVQRPFVLLAPTGRSASILGAKTRQTTSTIHAAIYAFEEMEVFEQAESRNDPGMRLHFRLKTEDPSDTLFIVDEASMVADVESQQDLLRFGSGRLLADLVEFARMGRAGRNGGGAKLLLVGDPAQLPPVREKLSPALSSQYLKDTFGLNCTTFDLIEVMRQQTGSAILDRATALRNCIDKKRFNTFDVSPEGDEVVQASVTDAVSLVTNAQLKGGASAVLITRSNAKALELNRAVRGRLWRDEKAEVQAGDLLLVNRNAMKYGLYNGDLVKVVNVAPDADRKAVRIRGVEDPVELTFRRTSVACQAADGQTLKIDCLLLENLLDSAERALAPLEQRALFVDFRERHPDLRLRTAEFQMALLSDTYFNALQVKYGYALTCHKAQGGEWDTAVVQFGDGRRTRNEEFFRWAYTAITRAKTRLLTVDAPKFSPVTGIEWPGPVPEAAPTQPTVPAGGEMPTATDNRRADSDWMRFSFRAGDEDLFTHHLRLREAWAVEAIAIEQLDHLQYCERYHLVRDGRHASVQYWYKGDKRVSRVGVAPGQGNDTGLAEDGLAAMQAMLQGGRIARGPTEEPTFVRAFRQRVEDALADAGIQVVSHRKLPFALRLEFDEGGFRSKLDFFHDKSERWTKVQEVGGPGASAGMAERLRELLRE